MALASCQDIAEDPGPNEVVAEPSVYPSLHTVPPRPQLSYTIEQRRAVIDGMVADRENARYSDQVVRYRTGLSGLPPPDTPPVAAAPPTVAPEGSSDGRASASPGAAPDRLVVGPETEFIYEDDDDFDSFLNGLTGDRIRGPGAVAPGPESNAAPLAPTIVRAGAARPVGSPAAAYDGPPPGAVWAIPVETAGLPDAHRPTATPASGNREATSPPAPVGPAMAGRAPGVVWGMVDRPDRPAAATASAAQVAAARGESAAGAAVPRGPAAATPIETADDTGQRLQPTDTALAGRAPGVVWGMVDRPDGSAGPAATASAVQVADTTAATPAASELPRRPASGTPIQTGGEVQTTDGSEESAEPVTAVVADRSDHQPPLETNADAAGIEVRDGLIAVGLAPSAERERAVESIAFAPGSATLPPDAAARLERFLAEVKAPAARIRVVSGADSPALALDRALAVGVALVQRGVPADRLELTWARDAVSDQARLSVAPSAR